jgi:hypothetical protein
VLICALLASTASACGSGTPGEKTAGGTGGTTGEGGVTADAGLEDANFNQCGVAAPLPADTGHCVTVHTPAITNFDDYVPGTSASSYTYYVNGKPPATDAVLGVIQHIGDGSDMNGGTSVISTDMVTGEGGAGYALQIADTDATHWGGALLFYLPASAAPGTCLNAQAFHGVGFSIQGSAPSGSFAVSLATLETMTVANGGLCKSADSTKCLNATITLPMPADTTTWKSIQLPWSAFTPGVGSGQNCIPVTGQNIVQLIIQPLMSYPPPNYSLQPGPYTVAVDNVAFF